MEKLGSVLNLQQSARNANSGNNTSDSLARNYPNGLSKSYVSQKVMELKTFLGLVLSDSEQAFWMKTLGEYNHWKLESLGRYRLNERGFGRTLADVCKWLDELMPDVKDSPSYRKPMEKNLLPHHLGPEFRKCLSCLMKIQTGIRFDLNEKEILAKAWKEAMINKFPNYNG